MPKQYVRKYFIMGSQDCSRNPEDILAEAIHGGITAFQYREKGVGALKGDKKIALAKTLRSLCKKHDIPFFINDDVELIEMLQVDGVHVGQSDTPVHLLRKKYPHIQIGLSVSNVEELKNSPIHLVDYVGAGPIYPTTSKIDAKQTVGLEWIKTLRERYPDLAIVGIGGIQLTNAKDVLHAGADGVAVISAITKANDIDKIVKTL